MSRPVKASIDMSALRQNQHIVRRAAPGSRLWAVVKARLWPRPGKGLERAERRGRFRDAQS